MEAGCSSETLVGAPDIPDYILSWHYECLPEWCSVPVRRDKHSATSLYINFVHTKIELKLIVYVTSGITKYHISIHKLKIMNLIYS